MSVWLTYSLTDFLLFSPQTYFRLLELYNRAIWPAQLPGLLLGLLLLPLLRRPEPASGRLMALVLAACWLWVGWAYLHRHYATINWAAEYAAAGFGIQAALLLAVAAVGRPVFRIGADVRGLAGLGLVMTALVLMPLLGPLLGRPWTQIGLFGSAPDPTAVATLGVLLLAERDRLLLLQVVPLLWCVVSAMTLWAMEAPEAWVMLAVVAVTLGATVWRMVSSLAGGRGSAVP